MLDSVHYKYSGNRGGVAICKPPIVGIDIDKIGIWHERPFNYRNINFDTVRNLMYPIYAFSQKESKKYDVNNNLIEHSVISDTNTVLQRWFYYYNSSNMLIKIVAEVSDFSGIIIRSQQIDSFVYNGLGLITKHYLYTRRFLGSSDHNRIDYYYSVKLDSQISYQYTKTWGLQEQERTYYMYDGVGNLIEKKYGSTTSYIIKKYTYNSRNLLVSDSEATSNSPSIMRVSRMLAYDTKGNLINHKGYIWLSITPPIVLEDETVIDYDANDNVTDMYKKSGGKILKRFPKLVLQYNTAQNLQFAHYMDWDSVSSTWVNGSVDTEYHFYYTPLLSVNNVKEKNLDCKVFPTPATSYINIEMATTNNDDVRVALYGVDGSLVRNYIYKPTIQGHYTVQVADVQPGMYMVHINNGTKSAVKRVQILH